MNKQSFLPNETLNSKPQIKIISAAILLIFTLSIAAWHLSYFHDKPFGFDVMMYAVVGHEMLAGRDLYSDLWDHKPPAVFDTYAAAEILFGYNWFALYAVHTAALLITLFGIYAAVRAVGGGQFAALWAAALWVLLSGDIPLEGHDPNTEVLINACLIWAFVLFLRPRSSAFGLGRSLAIGALFALASLYKPVAIIGAAFMSGVHVAIPPAKLDRRRALAEVCLIASVGALTWAAMIGYFAVRGRFADFWQAVFTYNSYYSGNALGNAIIPLLRGKVLLLPWSLVPLAMTATLGMILSVFKNLRAGAMLVAFAGATWCEIAAPGQFYDHYYLLWLPPLIVGAGWALSFLAGVVKRSMAWSPHAVGIALLVVLSLYEIPFYRKVAAGDYSMMMSPRASAVEQVAQKVNALLAPEETLFVLATAPGIYFWSRRHPPTGILFEKHLSGPLARPFTSRLKADLQSAQPELIVARSVLGTNAREVYPMRELITERYRLISKGTPAEPFDLFVRRAGRLESRLGLAEQ